MTTAVNGFTPGIIPIPQLTVTYLHDVIQPELPSFNGSLQDAIASLYKAVEEGNRDTVRSILTSPVASEIDPTTVQILLRMSTKHVVQEIALQFIYSNKPNISNSAASALPTMIMCPAADGDTNTFSLLLNVFDERSFSPKDKDRNIDIELSVGLREAHKYGNKEILEAFQNSPFKRKCCAESTLVQAALRHIYCK